MRAFDWEFPYPSQRMPVLVLTARDTVDDRVHGLDLGADDYMVKPFAMPELVARVRALIRRSQAQSGPRIVHGPLTLDTVARRAFRVRPERAARRGRPFRAPTRNLCNATRAVRASGGRTGSARGSRGTDRSPDRECAAARG